ncbi:MAG: recombinase family protein [Oscillospiraceae bacterium]|nr:recombinase family protein [Oscillospiraceae bacterium]
MKTTETTQTVAVYARQSVDRKDSISIENQIEICRKKIGISSSGSYLTFTDKGFSGKNTERPELKRMMSFIREGQINKVIVYKLDRISRSLLDFLKIQQDFEKHRVEFISCGEDFDTSTPMGKMLLNILMMFAEMERETIQKRVSDNYYARGEKGFYLGGYAPFGFNKEETLIDGKKTFCFIENQSETEIVRYLYEQFSTAKQSVGQLVREINAKGSKTRRGGSWSTTTMVRLLSNPIYVKADSSVYTYLKSKGATINNAAEDFKGENGCYVYGKASERNGTKFKSFKSDFVTIAPHSGVIDSGVWLSACERLNGGEHRNNTSTGSLSWLQGLVRCACGYSRYVKRVRNKYSDIRYFYCRGKKQGTCNSAMFRADILESRAEKMIFTQLKERVNAKKETPAQKCKSEREKARKQINRLINQIADGLSDGAIQYINQTIETLDKKITELDYEMIQLELTERRLLELSEKIADWDGYDIRQKKLAAEMLIREIKVSGSEIKFVMR